MKYEYDDEFVTSGIDNIEIEKIENNVFIEINEKLGITDSFYLEKLTIAKVYMELCRRNLEANGMKDKYDIYKNDFDFYFKSATKTNGGIGNIPLVRG